VAPDANIADVGWETLRKLAHQLEGVRVKESQPRTIEFPGGGWLQVKGAHLPGKLRARTLHFVVVDEAAFIDDPRRWNSELQPTLAINRGEGLFISTFNGENWFYDLYQLGQSDDPEWESWRKPSTENPYFPPEELERARRTTPQAEFEQEYLANPLIYVGAVFPGEKVQEAVERGAGEDDEVVYPPAWPEGDPRRYEDLRLAYAGLDWGYTNATAFIVCKENSGSGRVTWFHEHLWTQTDIDVRVNAIVKVCREQSVEAIYADAASPADNARLVDALDRAELPTEVVAVPFGKWKDTGIKTRRWFLENGLEDLSPACPQLIRSTKRYHYKEGTEDVVKEDDHPVDAATAFYSSRSGALVGDSVV
jgi:hypothetical protein